MMDEILIRTPAFLPHRLQLILITLCKKWAKIKIIDLDLSIKMDENEQKNNRLSLLLNKVTIFMLNSQIVTFKPTETKRTRIVLII